MKLYNHQNPATLVLTFYLLAGLLLASCRKEKAPEPSNLDKNYFVIEDNPNDPIDHSIYTFYKSTGIATFYNDSIYKKRISREGEIPERFAYIKLTFTYAPFGNTNAFYSKLLSSRSNIQALLQLLETEMIPKLPSAGIIPSILLLDSFSDHTYKNVQIPHGFTSICGFNTVGITVEDVEMMNNEERKMYTASILAGIAARRLSDGYEAQLQKRILSAFREPQHKLPFRWISIQTHRGCCCCLPVKSPRHRVSASCSIQLLILRLEIIPVCPGKLMISGLFSRQVLTILPRSLLTCIRMKHLFCKSSILSDASSKMPGSGSRIDMIADSRRIKEHS